MVFKTAASAPVELTRQGVEAEMDHSGAAVAAALARVGPFELVDQLALLLG